MKKIKIFEEFLNEAELNLSPEAKKNINQFANARENEDTDLKILASMIANKEEYGNLSPKDAEDALFRALIGG